MWEKKNYAPDEFWKINSFKKKICCGGIRMKKNIVEKLKLGSKYVNKNKRET